MSEDARVPPGWAAEAHRAWVSGQRQAAINAVLARINGHGSGPRPLQLVLQLAYYIFLCGDPKGAAVFLEDTRRHHPKDPQLLLNLAVCLSRSRQLQPALDRISEYIALRPDDPTALDCLCATSHGLGRLAEAAQAGTRALELKDRAAGKRPPGWALPAGTPQARAGRAGRRNVIAFSLWGDRPRYLCGALDNALAAASVYPGWVPVFSVDPTVPSHICEQLVRLGAEVRMEPPGQSTRQKLAWRFKVANDAGIGRFLVRDVDSVLCERERAAVDEWVASGRWFHVMRDWWTHTDLMLAGMWGGVAGVLPDLTLMLAAYRPGTMETPNVDQWFLRDRVWAYVRTSCMVHDRCFSPAGARPWPGAPPLPRHHVGQDEYAVRRAEQADRLARAGLRT